MVASADTIVAIATAAGPAGIGVLRLSGPRARDIAQHVCGRRLHPRHAHHCRFRDGNGEAIDDGIALYFRAPRSYTGEAVVELQAHGNPLLLARLERRCLALGARAARPGEFTERAFLNGKLDLAQAEAVADLIAAGSEAALRAARRSLDGVFSHRVQALQEALTALRVWIEAALDFPGEEIDFLSAPELAQRLAQVRGLTLALQADAGRGKRLTDGLHAVIVGAPNAGKSSLLNALAGRERAIVTEIAGTTRDLLETAVQVDGLQVTLVDTAGLRESADAIEREGMRRARAELQAADLALAVLDDAAGDGPAQAGLLREAVAAVPRTLWVHNKCDLSGRAPGAEQRPDGTHVWVSARTGLGLERVHAALRAAAGGEAQAGAFSARERHLAALAQAHAALEAAAARLAEGQGELAAEELRRAQAALGEITGRLGADDLLGRIFAGFCIGK
jgi:tRNA modification GTPase